MPYVEPPVSYHRIRELRARAIREAVRALAGRIRRSGVRTWPGWSRK